MAGNSSKPCQWIARDSEGRPRCEHGWALRAGTWRCPEKRRRAVLKYRLSEKGMQTKGRWNQSETGRASKQRYEEENWFRNMLRVRAF